MQQQSQGRRVRPPPPQETADPTCSKTNMCFFVVVVINWRNFGRATQQHRCSDVFCQECPSHIPRRSSPTSPTMAGESRVRGCCSQNDERRVFMPGEYVEGMEPRSVPKSQEA